MNVAYTYACKQPKHNLTIIHKFLKRNLILGQDTNREFSGRIFGVGFQRNNKKIQCGGKNKIITVAWMPVPRMKQAQDYP